MFIASRRVLLVNLQGQRHRYTHDLFPDLALAFLHFPWQMQVRVTSSTLGDEIVLLFILRMIHMPLTSLVHRPRRKPC